MSGGAHDIYNLDENGLVNLIRNVNKLGQIEYVMDEADGSFTLLEKGKRYGFFKDPNKKGKESIVGVRLNSEVPYWVIARKGTTLHSLLEVGLNKP